MPMNEDGTFSRVWKFVTQFTAGEDITRVDMDIALDDVAEGVQAALERSESLPALAETVEEQGGQIATFEEAIGEATLFGKTWFDTLADFENDRNLTYAGSGTIVAPGNPVSTRLGWVFEVAAANAVDAHYQNDHTGTPVKVYEAGFQFTTLGRFKQAVARGQGYRSGAVVFAAGIAYVYLGDGNTNIADLTGWALLFVAKGSTDDLAASGTAPFLALARGAALPVIGNSGVTDGTLAPGPYAYAAGSTGGPAGVTSGVLLHWRRAAGGGEVQILVADAPTEHQGRVYRRSREAAAWIDWRRDLIDTDVLDEDAMASDSASKVPTQQSVKAYVDAQPLARAFESAVVAVPATDTPASVAHGLGVRPKLFSVSLRCTTADLGYAVGDEVQIAQDEGDGGRGVTVWCNATNIGFLRSGELFFANRSASGKAAITPESWRLVFRGWRG